MRLIRFKQRKDIPQYFYWKMSCTYQYSIAQSCIRCEISHPTTNCNFRKPCETGFSWYSCIWKIISLRFKWIISYLWIMFNLFSIYAGFQTLIIIIISHFLVSLSINKHQINTQKHYLFDNVKDTKSAILRFDSRSTSV